MNEPYMSNIFCWLVQSKYEYNRKWSCPPKRKVNIFITALPDCLTRGPIHRQTRVTFYDFAEVNFRDFLLTETNVDSLTDRDEATNPL